MEERTKWDGKGKALCVLQVSHVKKKKKKERKLKNVTQLWGQVQVLWKLYQEKQTSGCKCHKLTC